VDQSSNVKPLPAGTVISGGYRILKALAAGGMGTVYEAEQIATGARRAVKVMHGQFAGDEVLRARFVREARLAASIPSDHVAQVVDAGHDEGSGALYIVLELLEGTTLSREVRTRGAFAWPDVLEIMRQVAHALAAAHARGIVHRDLKPANIFLSRSRHAGLPLMVKVLDFGIAKAVAGAHEASGVVLGTPAWMAPEQTAVDVAIGPPADVWSFGLLAFLLLTGQHFFQSANARSASTAAVLREVVIDPVIPASERAAQLRRADRLPPDFDGWFARCLDREPAKRFVEAAQAYAALAQLTAPTPAEPVPAFTSTETPRPPVTLARPDTPATAIETPLASRASQAPGTGASFMSARPPAGGLRAGWLLGVASLTAAVFGVILFLRSHKVDPQAVAVSTAATALPVAPPPSVRLHGSNTIGAELAPALAEAFLQKKTGSRAIVRRRTAPDEVLVEAREGASVVDSIEVFAHGSATAFQDLLGGTCDIGMSSRRIHPDETEKLSKFGDMASAASEHVIALDGIAIVVNPSNPVSSLNKAQLRDVFSGQMRSWSDVGGNTVPITVYARDDKSGTFDTFKHLVLGDKALAPEAKRYEASDQLSDAVAGDAGGIGFIGLPYVRSSKAVMVQEAGSVPLLPSPMTVSTEDYPLARRLYLYASLGAPIGARDFVDFALSEEGQKVVQAAGFVDLRPECDPNASRCTACSAQYKEAVHGACRLSVDFRFDKGNAELDTRALRDLQRLVTLMGRPENSSKSIVLLGFSDGTGQRSDNVTLSQQRASMVAGQLSARGLHVDTTKGLGSEMAVADDSSDDGRQRNRRVEAWLH
jgi:phosphate transport system substrate-binding protein